MTYFAKPIKQPPSTTKRSGFSLIEVLVAMVIIAIALLGFAKMQLLNSQNFINAYARTQTVMFLEEMIAKLHSNQALAKAGDFNFNLSTLTSVSSFANSNSLAKKEFYDWINSINHILPGSQGGIFCNTSAICAITINYSSNLGTIEQTMMTKL